MATSTQDKNFRDAMVGTDLLDKAIDWIGDNLEPQDVFPAAVLRQWAENNGMIEDEG